MGRKHKNEDPNYFHGYCAVAWYLICGYLYYEHNRPIATDKEYEQLCKHLLKHWDKIEHPHKKYLDKESLRCGTGFHLKWKHMPQRIIYAAHHLYKKKTGFDLPFMVQGRDIVKIQEKRYGKKASKQKGKKKSVGSRTDVSRRRGKKKVSRQSGVARRNISKNRKGEGLLF